MSGLPCLQSRAQRLGPEPVHPQPAGAPAAGHVADGAAAAEPDGSAVRRFSNRLPQCRRMEISDLLVASLHTDFGIQRRTEIHLLS